MVSNASWPAWRDRTQGCRARRGPPTAHAPGRVSFLESMGHPRTRLLSRRVHGGVYQGTAQCHCTLCSGRHVELGGGGRKSPTAWHTATTAAFHMMPKARHAVALCCQPAYLHHRCPACGKAFNVEPLYTHPESREHLLQPRPCNWSWYSIRPACQAHSATILKFSGIMGGAEQTKQGPA